eukprot:14207906-Alexandrium_andersonii.AAC.1
MGVAGVASDGAWQIRSCAECKRKVGEEAAACPNHPAAGTEKRWLLSLEIADETGRGTELVYHDVAKDIDVLRAADSPEDARAQRKILLALRAAPWSV